MSFMLVRFFFINPFFNDSSVIFFSLHYLHSQIFEYEKLCKRFGLILLKKRNW